MAVAQGIPPSIAPSYQQVLAQLQNTAQLESTRPTIMGTAANVIEKQNEMERQKGLLEYKASLEDQLSQKNYDRAFVNNGGIEVTDTLLKDMEQQAGFPEGTLPRDLVGKRFKDQQDFQEFTMQPVYRKHMQDELNKLADQYDEDGSPGAHKYAGFLRGTANLPPDKLATVFDQIQKHISETNKAQKPVPYADPSSSTGYRWSQPNSDGKYIKAVDDLEAPASSAGKGGAAKPIPVSERKNAIDRNSLANDIQSLFNSYSPDKVGAYDYRKTQMEQKTGVGSSKSKADFVSTVNAMKNRILNLRNGQRITQSEADRLMQELPDPNSKEVDFTQKLQRFAEEFNSIQSEYNDSLTKGGFTGVPEPKLVTVPDNWGPNYTPSKVEIKIMTDPKTKKQYNVEIDANGKRKILGEVNAK